MIYFGITNQKCITKIIMLYHESIYYVINTIYYKILVINIIIN